jgi:hypothetical protein
MAGPLRHNRTVEERPIRVPGYRALSKVSVQPDEANHSSSHGDDRSAVAANQEAEPYRCRAYAHHRDVCMTTRAGVTDWPRRTGHACRYDPRKTGRSHARTGGGPSLGGIGRDERRDGRHLDGTGASITGPTVLR